MEGELAEPGQDFVAATGYVILQDGQTSAAIPVTILEVKRKVFFPLPLNGMQLVVIVMTLNSLLMPHKAIHFRLLY